MTWKQLSTKEIFRSRWLWFTEDEVELENGTQATFAVLHKQPFALIIPWDGERFILVGQYRYHVDSYSWEFPQGHYEHRSILETAQRELKEETGCTADKVEPIGSFYAAPGAIDQECRVFLATGLHAGETELEPTEHGLQSQKVTPDEMKNMIQNGEIKDGTTITALYLFLNGEHYER